MEKKTIIAFALSFLVLILWYTVFGPKNKPVVPEEGGVHDGAKTAAPELIEKPAAKAPVIHEAGTPEGKQFPSSIHEKEIAVETPLYRIIFSNVGVSIKSCQLKEYKLTTDPDSPPVELVHNQSGKEGFLSAFFNNQSIPEAADQDLVFRVNTEENIRLAPGSRPRDLTFECMRPDGIVYSQTFRFYPDRYDIDLSMNLTNSSGSPVQGNIKAYLQNTPPQKKTSYYAFVGLALLLDGDLERIKTKKMKEDKYLSGKIGWIAYEDDYFISSIIPEDTNDGNFIGKLLPSGAVIGEYIYPAITLRPLEQAAYTMKIYLGPLDLDILRKIDKKLDLAVNYGFFDIIAKPLHYALRFFNKYVHNFGISIIILTVLIKIIFWPLTHKSYKSMKEMQKLQPIMAKIREKYKNNKEQMQKELMGLYKTYKVNPMGGCLPMVIQIPVFFALYRILGTSIELRHAPFFLWIKDLSAPDRLFHFPFSIPFMSPPYGIPVLTLLMGASMFIQQKMTPTAGDPSQAKVMMFLPIIFTVMFINFPSGLVLYWLTNNILSICQQYRITKKPG